MKFINYLVTLFFQINLSYSFYPKTILSKISIHHFRNKYKHHEKVGYKKSKQILFKHFKNLIIYGDSNNELTENINCEHIWCQKYFNYQEPMKSDLHILYLSNSKLNSHRNDFKFSDIYLNYTNIDIQGNKINMSHSSPFNIIYKKNTNKKIFEPYYTSKGKVVRSLAYFYIIYDDKQNNLDKLIDIDNLLTWNRNHIPDIKEIQRNEIIYLYQNNINPFIKYPILVEIIFNHQFNIIPFIKLSFITLYSIIISNIFKFYYKIIEIKKYDK
jgi:endonuclease I